MPLLPLHFALSGTSREQPTVVVDASTSPSLSVLARVRRYVRNLWQRREFAWFMAMGNLKAQNASTSLGILWYVLNPLLLSAVYFIVFGVIFPGTRGEGSFLAYLVSGMFAFHFTARALSGAAGSILKNQQLVMNLRFPRLLLPISTVIEAGVGFLVSILAYLVIIVPITREVPDVQALLFLPVFLCQIILNVGLAALMARMAIPFRDLNNFVPYFTRLWLYLSPIIWSIDRLDALPSGILTLVYANPMFYYLSVYRSALLGTEFEPGHLLISFLVAIAVALVGVGSFVRYEGRLAQDL